MVVVDVDTTVMRRGLAALVRDAKISRPVVLKKEAGELVKTLVRVTPPSQFAARCKTLSQLHDAMTRDVNSKFNLIGNELNSHINGRGVWTRSGLYVFASSPGFLFATLPAVNREDATPNELAKERWDITKKGWIRAPFKKPRKRQITLISRTVITKRSTIKKVVALVKTKAGRMKAGWLVGYFQGKVQLTGVNLPPAWVTRHASGARGWIQDNSKDTGPEASFTVANFSKGVTHKQIQWITNNAVKIRAQAMLQNAAMFVKGKKRLSQYA